MLDEFKKFILRGNVIDLAVGVIMGGAFGAITKSLVDDVIMPPIGLLTGGVDFGSKFLILKDGAKAAGPYPTLDAAKEAGAVALRYGAFINTIVTFLIVAFSMFLLVRAINHLYKPAPPPPAPPMKDCPKCLSSIPEKATKCGHCTADLA